MDKAIIGKKLGMSQVFTEDGKVIPVTVVEAGPCPVVQVKTKQNEGYDAVQVAFGEIKPSRVSKPVAGHFKKSNIAPQKYLRELRFDDCSKYSVGSEIKCDAFAVGDKVDVSGISKGHGYSGVIQRWNFHRGPSAHGSGFHRGIGSMGANSSPSRIFKNKKMPGHWGTEKVTVRNLTVAKIDSARNLLLIKGAIPGSKGSLVVIKKNLNG